jgi:sigma-E factor negative regulatory protein RseA
MTTGSVTEALLLEQLSALADGEMDPAGVEAACARWRDDVRVRTSWHAYHLIGDVLRSEDLAIEPSRDVALLAAVRDRLSREAVVLAPAPAAERGRSDGKAAGTNTRVVGVGRRWPWVVSSAVAAGFVAVLGTFTLIRQAGPETAESRTVASVGSPTPVATRTDVGPAPVAATVPAPARSLALDESGIVRDPSLDAYLAAHKQFAGSTALGVPSAFLRSATVRTYGR